MLCGQFGVAGSSKIGKRFIGAGQAAVTQGVNVADGVTLGGRCGVTQSIEEPGVYMGLPHRPANEWRREVLALRKLPDLIKQIKTLEEQVQKLQSSQRD